MVHGPKSTFIEELNAVINDLESLLKDDIVCDLDCEAIAYQLKSIKF